MKLFKSSFIMASGTLTSRVLAIFRDALFAAKLGATGYADAFFAAFVLPNFLRNFFAEGAFQVALVPFLTRIRDEKGDKVAHVVASSLFTGLFLVICSIVLAAELFMPQVMGILAPGLKNSPDSFALAIVLGRITMPYLVFISLASFYGGVCQMLGKFAPFAYMPVLLNISFISMLFIFTPGFNPYKVASYAVIVGGIAQFLFMFYITKKTNFIIKLTLNKNHENISNKHFWKNFFKVALSSGIIQLSVLVDIRFASLHADGGLSYLQYASRFYNLPLSLLSLPLAIVLLPSMSRFLKTDLDSASKYFEKALMFVVAIGFGAMVFFLSLGDVFIAILYERGQFTHEMTLAVFAVLACYIIGLPFVMINKIIATTYYAKQDTSTPLKRGAVSLFSNIALNFAFIGPFGIKGVALATAISSIIGTLLYIFAFKNVVSINNKYFTKFTLKSILVALVLALFLFYAKDLLNVASTNSIKYLILLLICFFSAIVYFFTFWALGVRFKHFR